MPFCHVELAETSIQTKPGEAKPNHLHGIIAIGEVGTAPRVCPSSIPGLIWGRANLGPALEIALYKHSIVFYNYNLC